MHIPGSQRRPVPPAILSPVLFFLAATLLHTAQTPAIERKFALRSITFRGNRAYTREQLLAVSGLRLGELVAKPEFDTARDKLLGTGVFETVGYQFGPGPGGQGYSANFDIVEITGRFPVEFENLGAPAPEIEAFLKAPQPAFYTFAPRHQDRARLLYPPDSGVPGD